MWYMCYLSAFAHVRMTLTVAPIVTPLVRTHTADNRRKYDCSNIPSVPRTSIPLIVPCTRYRGFLPHTTCGTNGTTTKINEPSCWIAVWNDMTSSSLITNIFRYAVGSLPAWIQRLRWHHDLDCITDDNRTYPLNPCGKPTPLLGRFDKPRRQRFIAILCSNHAPRAGTR